MEGGGEGREVAGDRIALSTLLAFLFGGGNNKRVLRLFLLGGVAKRGNEEER
jgi:hypothetical protein